MIRAQDEVDKDSGVRRGPIRQAISPMNPLSQRQAHPNRILTHAAGYLSGTVRLALDLLFPPTCAVCGREGRFLCERCEGVLPRLRQPHCARCAGPGSAPLCSWCTASAPDYDGIRAPYLMEGAVREMVYSLKYRNMRASAPELGRLLAGHLRSAPLDVDVLVPVPLHSRRQRERGYNQSDLLARGVGRHTGIPVGAHALRRVRDTAPQVSMSTPEERRQNIEGAFECISSMSDRRVLLIDDVVTTGATMSACAGPLKAAGASSVWGLTLAR